MASASPVPFWQLLTRLGEIQILLPLALLCAWWLWRQSVLSQTPEQARLARRWIACLGVAIGLTGASKLAFFGWGWGIAAWDFTGISGHAMASAAILPLLAWFAMMGQPTRLRSWTVGLGFGLAAMIAYSRFKVGAHSPAEAMAGFLIGSAASLLSLRAAQPAELSAAPPLWLPVGLLAGLLLMSVAAPKSRSHDWVIQLSLHLSGRAQPFVRGDLHRHSAAVLLLKAPASARGNWGQRKLGSGSIFSNCWSINRTRPHFWCDPFFGVAAACRRCTRSKRGIEGLLLGGAPRSCRSSLLARHLQQPLASGALLVGRIDLAADAV